MWGGGLAFTLSGASEGFWSLQAAFPDAVSQLCFHFMHNAMNMYCFFNECCDSPVEKSHAPERFEVH